MSRRSLHFYNLEAEWKQRCQTYDQERGDGSVIPGWPAALGQPISFKTLYSKPAVGSAQSVYLQALRARNLQMCPMCGEAGTPNTLDHYLPQEHYPDFAILPQNMG